FALLAFEALMIGEPAADMLRALATGNEEFLPATWRIVVLLDEFDLQRPRMGKAQGHLRSWYGRPKVDEIIDGKTHGEEGTYPHLPPPLHRVLAVAHNHAELANAPKQNAHKSTPLMSCVEPNRPHPR